MTKTFSLFTLDGVYVYGSTGVEIETLRELRVGTRYKLTDAVKYLPRILKSLGYSNLRISYRQGKQEVYPL